MKFVVAMLFLTASCSSAPNGEEQNVNDAVTAEDIASPDTNGNTQESSSADPEVDKLVEDVGGPIVDDNEKLPDPPLPAASGEPLEGNDTLADQGKNKSVEAVTADDASSLVIDDSEKLPPSKDESTGDPKLDFSSSNSVAATASSDLADVPQQIPAAVPAEVAARSTPVGDKFLYVVHRGESLSLIAKRFYGSNKKWKLLAKSNKIKDPNRVRVGQLIRISVSDSNRLKIEDFVARNSRTIEVKRGDTLAKIAKRAIGSGYAWRYIWKYNASLIPNPHRIEVGTVLQYLAAPKSRGIAKKVSHKDGASH